MAYKVKRQFTDSSGKTWKPGEPFIVGNQEEIDRQVDAGNIEVIEPKTGGGERGGAPA